MKTAVLVCCLTFVAAGLAAAQTSTVQGTVRDGSEAPLPGSMIVLTSDGAGNAREAIADRTGAFTFEHVPAGRVDIHVELSGFQPATVSAVVTAGQTAAVTVILKVGFAEEVTVSAEGAGRGLSPARNMDAVEFESEDLRRIPTSGQDLQSLVDTFTATPAFGGNSVIVDGVETDGLGIPAAAVSKLVVNRNPYSAEFKSPGKARVEVETERGSRRFYHGSGALFMRDSALDARNAFAASTPHRNRALNEGAFGGPLPGKGWSFFTSAQYLFDNDAEIVNAQTLAGSTAQNVPTSERRGTVFGRVDFRPNKTDALTLHYDLFDDVERNHGIGGFKLAELAYASIERRQRTHVGDHRIGAGGLLNDLRVEVGRSAQQNGARPSGPEIVVPGAFAGGASQVFDVSQSTSVQVEEVASLTVGAHAVRIGGRLKSRWNDVTDGSNFGGTFTFATLADFARSAPLLFTRRSGNPTASFTDVDGSLFAEATFRPNEAVGLTTGVRYDWQARVGDWNNVAPRIALAFAPVGRHTVFRTGFGYFYQAVPVQAISQVRLFGSGGLEERAVANPSFPAIPEGALAAVSRSAAWQFAPALRLPATLQASVGIEHMLGRRSAVTAEYLLLRGRGGLRTRDVNEPFTGTDNRPDPTHLNVFQIEPTAASRTDQASVTLRARLQEFRGTVQYTLSRTIDDASSVLELPVDSDHLALERGRADYDRRHRLNVAGTYGWKKDRVRLGGVLAVRSGAPFNIVTGRDDNHDLVANDRPLGVTRNTGDGPAFAQLDLRLTTVFRAPRPRSEDPQSAKREQRDNLELNVDVFNVFNRVNATTFVGVVGSPLFGLANSARTPRAAQLSLRYRF